jgi:hypothetical protein
MVLINGGCGLFKAGVVLEEAENSNGLSLRERGVVGVTEE